jgi:hypothetical protein
MNNVTLCNDPYNSESWETIQDVGDIRAFLKKQYLSWPKTAHIYHNHVAENCDVTPYDEGGVEKLGKLEGNFFVVVYPEGIELIVAIVAIAVAAVAIGLAILLRPSPNVKNQQQESPTNSLSNRQNRERPNERIPDIYGEKWVTPDLIAVPYRVFIGNKEVEYSAMCVGRGEYDIAKVRDDLTPVENIDGASVEFYGPDTSPNSGDEPFLRFGNAINETIKQVKQYSSANGQVLRAPNANTFKAATNVAFQYPDAIIASGDIDFTDYFAVGTVLNPTHITLTKAIAKSSTGATLDLNGTYEIADVQANQITLVTPSGVNANWNSLSSFPGETSIYGNPVLTSTDDRWIGPFTIDDPDITEVWCNFVCPQGLYELDKNANQFSMIVQVQVGIQAIDSDKQPIGAEVFYSTVIIGSADIRSQRAATLKCVLPLAGPCQVRARRFSSTDLRDNWNVVDQTQWRDLYGVAPLGVTDFGNVTTLQAVSWPTQDALAIKERKLNCLIARRIPKYKARYSAIGPHSVIGQPDTASWNESLNRLIWCVNRLPIGDPGPTGGTFGLLTNGAYSEITISGIAVGNSGGIDGQALLSDASNFWVAQFSGFDTAKWYKYAITGGAPLATAGGIGVFSPYDIPHGVDLSTISGTKYVLHRRGNHIQRFLASDLSAVDLTSGITGDGQIIHDASEKTWGFSADGIFDIDWSGPTVTNHTLTLLGSIQNMTYVASDDSILIATQTHIYKFDIATASIINSIAVTSNAYGISFNIGADGNFSHGGDIYDAETLALVSTSNPLSNFGGTGTWSTFVFTLYPFQIYDSTNQSIYVRNSSNQVWQLYLGAPGFVAGVLAPEKNAGLILIAMALDPYIGNRQTSEVDFDGILAAIGPSGANQAYFGTELCSEFCYSFDDSKVSFEEMALDVGTAAFATIYRRGNVISAFFEKKTENSTILFNHRNKIPDSEVRTVSFGMPEDADGIQLDYIDPNAPNQPDIDVTTTLYWPTDKSAINPKKITTIGIRNNVQAYMLGWRLFNKLRYQKTAVQFDATQEAALSIISERILVADNTRPETQDGEVIGQVSLEIELSQPVVFVGGRTYTIFLQHYDETVETIGITAGSTDRKVVLATAPLVPLVLNPKKFALTTYQIVDDSITRQSAFLLSEKEPKDGMVYSLKAGNYDDRFYDKDQDFALGNITENSGAGGYNAGYDAQSQVNVFVAGTCMPWMPKDNPSFDFGINDGKPPVAIKLNLSAGDSVNIAAEAPGQIVSNWLWEFATNTVQASDSRKPVDASGTSIDPSYTSPITGTTLGSTGKHFPTNTAAIGSYPLGLAGLYGTFAKLVAGKYIIQGATTLSIGFGGNFVLPTGMVPGDYLLLGTNDDHYRDNIGGFQVTVTQLALPDDPTVGTDTGDDTSGDGWQVDGNGPGELVPPAGEFLLTSKFGHNVAASNLYDKAHHPLNFTGTSVIGSSTITTVDSSKMDDSMNPSTPSHVGDCSINDCFTTIPSALPKGVHVTPWFGKSSGHINIGVNCNTDAYVIALLADLDNRGFTFISVDWYGPLSFEDLFLQRFKAFNALRTTPIKIVPCIDKGMTDLSQASLITAIDYLDTQYFGHALMIGGKPLIQFFGVRDKLKSKFGYSDGTVDTVLSTVKSSVATAAHWDFWEQSLRHKSYCDGCFDWTHNFVNGVDDADYGAHGPYNTHARDVFYTDMSDEPTKTIGASICPGFNGTETYSTRWSKNKYLPRDHGACWKSNHR